MPSHDCNNRMELSKSNVSTDYWHAYDTTIQAAESSCDTANTDQIKHYNPFIVILTAEQARAIYLLRCASSAEGSHAKSVAGKSSLVAEMFGVNPKTIRDVWSRKTWIKVSNDVNL
jgi:hypothetical protein